VRSVVTRPRKDASTAKRHLIRDAALLDAMLTDLDLPQGLLLSATAPLPHHARLCQASAEHF
jgi:hypothetical protein